jgi:hypothetical protein
MISREDTYTPVITSVIINYNCWNQPPNGLCFTCAAKQSGAGGGALSRLSQPPALVAQNCATLVVSPRAAVRRRGGLPIGREIASSLRSSQRHWGHGAAASRVSPRAAARRRGGLSIGWEIASPRESGGSQGHCGARKSRDSHNPRPRLIQTLCGVLSMDCSLIAR